MTHQKPRRSRARKWTFTQRRLWQRIALIAAAVVVFTTTYALILPGTALEKSGLTCTQEEHTHTDSCYTKTLTCGQSESEGHSHSAQCYDEDGALTCGQQESAGHTHTDSCYSSELTCGKTEHTHTSSCYTASEEENTTDTDDSASAEEESQSEDDETLTDGETDDGTDEESEDETDTDESEDETDDEDGDTEEEEDTDEDEDSEEEDEELEDELEDELEEELEEESEEEDSEDDAAAKEYTASASGVSVTASVREDALPEGAYLSVSVLTKSYENDSANGDVSSSAQAAADALDADNIDYDDFAALDLSFLDADGNEVEPAYTVTEESQGFFGATKTTETTVAASVEVTIELDADFLPEEADTATLAVQHLEESSGDSGENGVSSASFFSPSRSSSTTSAASVEDLSGEITAAEDGSVTVAFEVESFSTFTITWGLGEDESLEGEYAYSIEGYDDGYTVRLCYNDDAQIPEASELIIAVSEEGVDEETALAAVYGEEYLEELAAQIAAAETSEEDAEETDDGETITVSVPTATTVVRLSVGIECDGETVTPADGSEIYLSIIPDEEITLEEDAELALLSVTTEEDGTETAVLVDEVETETGSDDGIASVNTESADSVVSDADSDLAVVAVSEDDSDVSTAADDSASDGSGELNIEAYHSAGVVYWDLDDEDNSDQEEASYITSVTLNGTNVTFGESTDSNIIDQESKKWTDSYTTSYSLNTYFPNTSDGKYYTGYYDGSDNEEDAVSVDLTVTPAEGYYVTNITVVCSAYAKDEASGDDGDSNGNGGTGGGPSGNGPNMGSSTGVATAALGDDDDSSTSGTKKYRNPYNCQTLENGNEFTTPLTLSDVSSGSSTVGVTNKDFAHSGYKDWDSSTDSEYVPVYFILIKVAPIPTPVYVEYSYGEIVNYIETYNDDLNDDSSSVDTTVFATADTWTTANDGNVYVYSNTSSVNAGIETNYVQFKYAYDDSDDNSEDSTNWKHYANQVSESAEEAAWEAGYVFIGWSATYYQACDSTSRTAKNYETGNSSDGGYYNYYYNFSSSVSTNFYTEDEEVSLVTHIRLVAIWVPIDDVRTTGSLRISKTVTGTGTPDDSYHYTFTLSSSELAGKSFTAAYVANSDCTYTHKSTVTFGDNGTATVSLANGESVTLSGLANGTVITVTESSSTLSTDYSSYQSTEIEIGSETSETTSSNSDTDSDGTTDDSESGNTNSDSSSAADASVISVSSSGGGSGGVSAIALSSESGLAVTDNSESSNASDSSDGSSDTDSSTEGSSSGDTSSEYSAEVTIQADSIPRSAITITVTKVTDDNGNVSYTYSYSIDWDAVDIIKTVDYTNIYELVTGSLTVTKSLEGLGYDADQHYTFVIQGVASASNDSSGDSSEGESGNESGDGSESSSSTYAVDGSYVIEFSDIDDCKVYSDGTQHGKSITSSTETDEDGNEASVLYIEFSDGTATLYLAGGESATISGLDLNQIASVTESDSVIVTSEDDTSSDGSTEETSGGSTASDETSDGTSDGTSTSVENLTDAYPAYVTTTSTVTAYNADGGKIDSDDLTADSLTALSSYDTKSIQVDFVNQYSQFTITKVDGSGNTITSGAAVFTLTSSSTSDGTTTTYYYDANGNQYTECITISTGSSDSSDSSDASTILGCITVSGLADGTYTLTEVAAPDGYNLLGSTIQIVIKDGIVTSVSGNTSGKIDNGGTTDGDGNILVYTSSGLTVTNTTGEELPSTGGVGTGLPRTLGALLTMTAAAFLWGTFQRRKRERRAD